MRTIRFGGIALLATVLTGSLVACSSSPGNEVNLSGPTTSIVPSCSGGAFAGIEGSLATTHGDPTPEEAVATFTRNFPQVPAGEYSASPVQAGQAGAGTTLVPTSEYVHHKGGEADAVLTVESIDGTTWIVTSARYCP